MPQYIPAYAPIDTFSFTVTRLERLVKLNYANQRRDALRFPALRAAVIDTNNFILLSQLIY